MKNLKYIAGVLAAVAIAFLFAHGLNSIDASGYVTKSEKASPSGKFKVYEIESVSQEGPAPEGLHLVLSDKELVMKPEDGEVIFAGYCSRPLAYSWKSDEHIFIQCKPTEKTDVNARDKSKVVRGINVELKYLR